MASSSGEYDMSRLEKELSRDIELPSRDWVVTQSVAEENIVIDGSVQTFVKDNLNNNYLLLSSHNAPT